MGAIGHVDALTSCGYLEGWAHDADRPGEALQVGVLMNGREIGRGLANRYRWDLADIGYGVGWCAFRLRVDGEVSALRCGPLLLIDIADGVEIFRSGEVAVIEDGETGLASMDEVTRADPTVLQSIDQLRGCGALFDRYLARNGAEAFVRAAYVYVRARPADPGGLASYVAQLAEERMTPYGVLLSLHEDAELHSIAHQRVAPTEPGFAFAAA